jgi:cysteinyl-tRNA synthetase
MAKSLGNFVTVKDFLSRYQDADILKLFFLAAHYSSPVDYTAEKADEARQALERLHILKEKLERPLGIKAYFTKRRAEEIERLKRQFLAVMDDDFNTPQGLAVVFELANLANRNIGNASFMISARKALKEFLDIFGFTLRADLKLTAIPEEEVKARINQRQEARKNKDFALADKIRLELEARGIILEDARDGTTWRRKL